jgi:17beta-estradiol 17-dehydrogenase / very-long-chain 3-oxoacyl-CoA reductase
MVFLIIIYIIKLFIKLYLVYTIIKVLLFTYKNFIRKRMNLKKRYGENSWVLVTGATDGLGKVFCEEFAREGFNIILVSRTLEKLEKVSKEIENKFSVKTHYIQFDFLNTDIQKYKDTFEEVTKKYDLSILVNNIGLLEVGFMKNVEMQSCHNMAVANIIPQTVMTKLFCKYMSSRTDRSAVIDISSFSSLIPFTRYAIYGATKTFNLYLSRALAEEYESFNIDFMGVKPSYIATPMTGMKNDYITVLSPEQVVYGTLNDLGYEKETCGHWIHKITYNLARCIPKQFYYFIGF